MPKTALLLKQTPDEPPGLFEEILQEQRWKLEIRPLFSESLLTLSLNEFGMIMILGGPMDLPVSNGFFLFKREIPFIRQALKIGSPVLGINLGAGLMARALGARVYPGPHKEIGWSWVNQTPLAKTDPLFSKLEPYLLVFEWHGETFDLPTGAVCLAGNRAFPNQAFRFGPLSYGLQFHLEVTEPMIKTWLSLWAKAIALAEPQPLTPEDILVDARIYLDRLHAQARIFFLGYLKLIEKLSGKYKNEIKKLGGCYAKEN